MIALISAAAGSASAITVAALTGFMPMPGNDDNAAYRIQESMHAQPLHQTYNGQVATVPEEMLPLDATPTPGVPMEKGSMRPAIELKPGVKFPPASPSKGKLVLVKSQEKLKTTQDPVWHLQLVVDGKVVESMPALTGRAYRQTANRNIAGNKSPLPQGVYAIDHYGIERGPFGDGELGRGYWVPIVPLFSTQRSSLGFHQDPSWGKKNGESGTSGCIGLQSPEATAKLVQWIRDYHIKQLSVI